MIRRLQSMHARGWVHRDLKPENFCIGRSDPRTVYLIDFGSRTRVAQDGGSVLRIPCRVLHVLVTASGSRGSSVAFSSVGDRSAWLQVRGQDRGAAGEALAHERVLPGHRAVAGCIAANWFAV